MSHKISIWHGTHIGDKEINQDVYLVKKLDKVETIKDVDGKEHKTNVNPYLLIVADGHGKKGDKIAEFIVKEFEKRLNKSVLSLIDKDLLKAFDRVKDELADSELNFRKYGSTIILVIIYQTDEIYARVCNVGDSRMISGDTSVDFKTIDHKPDSEDELERFKKINEHIPKKDKLKVEYEGDIARIGNMAVSRSFGDYDTHPYIISVPDLYHLKLKKWTVIACDGLWDFYKNKKVIEFLNENVDEPVDKLISMVRNKTEDDMDNTTIIVFKLEKN